MTILGGVPGTYRLTDGHWTERGTEIGRLAVYRASYEDARNSDAGVC